MLRLAARLGTLFCWIAAVALLAGGVAALGSAHQTMLRAPASASPAPMVVSDGG